MSKEVTTADICNARDIRMEKLKIHFNSSADGVILFLLNIPGSIKDSPLYRKIFNTGLRLLKYYFNKEEISFQVEEINIPETGTGPEAYIAVYDSDLLKVKQISAEIENNHPLGRIFDIDLFDSNLEQIKSGREMRKCFVCSHPAFECARSRKHPLSEVIRHINTSAEKYFDSLCWKTASTAARAMMSEVLVTPKPGLVDRINSGAHSDMDIFTFADSTTALVKTFYDMACEGCRFYSREADSSLSSSDDRDGRNFNSDLTKLLTPLRQIGLEGEKTMFEITKGVNTQKGLIFSIGILAGAAGYLIAESRDEITPDLLCLTGKKIVKGITEKDFQNSKQVPAKQEVSKPLPDIEYNQPIKDLSKYSELKKNSLTTGEKLYKKHGIKGARGEAEGGFKSSLRALSILKTHIENEWEFNLSLADTLIHIISETEDTNIPGRNSIETLSYAEDKCREFIKEGGVFREKGIDQLKKLDEDFIEKNISPGGSADILATTLFLYFMETEINQTDT